MRPLLPATVLAILALACSGERRDATPPPEPVATRAAPAPAAPGAPASTTPDPARSGSIGEAPPAGPSVEARAEGENWVVRLEAPGVVPAGQRSLGLVRILARGGMHVNEEYPTAFKPGAGATADLGGDRVALREPSGRTPCPDEPKSACELRFPLPFTPRGAGEVRIDGTLAFSVCNAEKCLIEKAPLSVLARAR